MGHCRLLRPAGAVTQGIRLWYKYHAGPQLGAFDRVRQQPEITENTENDGAGSFTLIGESFVVPPVVSLSFLKGWLYIGMLEGAIVRTRPYQRYLGDEDGIVNNKCL